MTGSPRAPRAAWWLATGFGSGFLKPAPGTWGSLAGLVAWLLLAWTVRHQAWGSGFLLAAPILIAGIGVWAADRVVAETGQEDPSYVVIDEWAGLWIALTPLLLTGPVPPRPWSLAAPFLLFRLFDIWKPGPVDRVQHLPGGWGVMMDDVLAGLLAALLTWPLDRWVVARLLQQPGLWR